ncbi:hypothetical protein DY000_02030064 [Brassica cretica]|uniref:Uncharacterized protein n=1 Tax=Brassica cretica TaxID=69181 RepID=A0ABQ7DNC2_BRACR|nr:hypothetical protein DY000_02030064 [Brassica cretica]
MEPQLMALCGQKLLTNKAVNHSPRILKLVHKNGHNLSKQRITQHFLVLCFNVLLRLLKAERVYSRSERHELELLVRYELQWCSASYLRTRCEVRRGLLDCD